MAAPDISIAVLTLRRRDRGWVQEEVQGLGLDSGLGLGHRLRLWVKGGFWYDLELLWRFPVADYVAAPVVRRHLKVGVSRGVLLHGVVL